MLMLTTLILAATMADVFEIGTEVGLEMEVSYPVWVGYDKDMDHLYAYVDPHYGTISTKNGFVRKHGFVIMVTSKLLKLNKNDIRPHLIHEMCHIILDADVIGDRWKRISEAERESRHREVDKCVRMQRQQ